MDAPTMGHNMPPLYDEGAYSALEARARDLVDAGKEWTGAGTPTTDEEASLLADFKAQVAAAWTAAEKARKAAKEPHAKAAKDVDAAFARITGPLDMIGKQVAGLLTAFLAAKKDRERKEAESRAEAARAAEAEARAKLLQAKERGDLFAAQAAEAAEKAAAKEAKAAEKPVHVAVASATGGGRTVSMRTYWRANVLKWIAAISWLMQHPEHGPKLRETVTAMLEAERRAKDGARDIPGVEFIEEQRAA